MFKYYLEIVKPGIIFGNIILIMGSFLFASHYSIVNVFLLFNTVLGASLVIASSCVFNNLIDCDIDKKMRRTRNRVLSRNLLTPLSVVFFGSFLGLSGVLILGFLVNFLSMCLSIFGFLIYVIFYTLLYKRKSIYSTFIGSFAGSTPSIIGYSAVTNVIDLYSVLLFIIFIFWQMSHFYAISILRVNDYKKAKIPVFPVVKGVFSTKKHIFYYIIFFIISSSFLTFLGYLSYKFLFFSSIINIYWLYLSYCSFKETKSNTYSSKLFYFSIIVVVCFNSLMSIDFMF